MIKQWQTAGLAVVLLLLSFLRAESQNITKAEYFFDTDPGPGNGFNIPVVSGPNPVFTSNISVSGLPTGFHILGVRVKESGGSWSIFESRGFYISPVSLATTNVSRAEYYIDTDPGQGNGTPVTIPAGATVNTVFTVPTSSLPQGFHLLAFRVRDVFGRWSLVEARGFYITASVTNSADLSAAEFFFDTDPGQGNGTALTVTPGPNATFTVPVPVGSLSPGFHFLGIRMKGSNGKWGIFESRGFYLTGSINNAPSIAGAEYFFDTDPGLGKGTAVTIPGGDISNATLTIPVGTLSPGFHFLTIRIKDASGKWGVFESRGFYIYSLANTTSNIVEAEYFFDTDPGPGLATPTTITTPGLTVNQNLLINVNVPPGAHKLGVRVRDGDGIWSEARFSDFTVNNCTSPPTPTAPNVNRCNPGTVTLTAAGALSGHEYRWYAAEFGGTSIFTGASFTTPSISKSTDYFVSTRDPNSGCESARVKSTATVLDVTKPVLNASGTVTLCEGTSFLLSAPAGFSTYKWSNGALTQQILVTASGSYSVIVNNGLCDLPSTDAVIFDFLAQPATPTIAVDGNPAICNTGTVTLTGPAGATSYLWSGGQTTQSITVSTAGSYQLTVSNAAGCKSQSSVAVAVTVSTTPATPSISLIGSSQLCIDAFAVLFAPQGFTNYLWSNGETTQSIIVRDAGDYTVQVGNSPTCLSLSSTPATITLTGHPCNGTIDPNNTPPSIQYTELTTAVRGKAVLDLTSIISDGNGAADVNLGSLKITQAPPSGAVATINNLGVLTVDYGQLTFIGSDFVVVQVCDFAGSCTQQTIDITVAGEITAFNALSPNGDGLNETLHFEFIDLIPDTRSNQVTIYNRWGDVVWKTIDYDNNVKVFKGQDLSGNELPNGTYFYRIEFGSGKKTEEGFITLRR